MSGNRLHSYREGDRSEYFAQVLLSGLGLSTPIPNQEDIGFDFQSNIADQETGVLTFGSPYLVSVKSVSEPNIVLLPTPAAIKKKSKRHIEWLFRQELPAFLGVVDKKAFSLRLFSLIPVWFIYYENGENCGALTLAPQLDSGADDGVGRPTDEGEIKGWPGMHHFRVNLGNPIVTLDLDTLKDREAIKSVKNQIRSASRFAHLNSIHRQLGVPYFYWFAKIMADGSGFHPAFYCLPIPTDPEEKLQVVKELYPFLLSFALHYKDQGNGPRVAAIKELLSDIPFGFFPKEVRDAIPEIISESVEPKSERAE